MTERQERTTAKEVARKTIPFLSQKGIPITPNNYRIWFDYFYGENKEIKGRLDDLLKSDAEFTQEVNEELYNWFFERDFEKESTDKAIKELEIAEDVSLKASELIMNTIKGIIENSEATTEYGKKLKGYTKDLGKARKLDDVKNLLTTLLSDTQDAELQNGKVQKKLEETTGELKDLNIQLTKTRNEARTDTLTGLFNRRHFDELFTQNLDLIKNDKKGCSLIMLDIDFFKKFNDNYGHLVGDKLLKSLAKEIKRTVTDKTSVCRYGGEEFILICPEISLDQAYEMAERIRKGIKEEVEFTVRSNPVKVTVSLGVAQIYPEDTKKTAIERVDAAMYLAKSKGRDITKTERDMDA